MYCDWGKNERLDLRFKRDPGKEDGTDDLPVFTGNKAVEIPFGRAAHEISGEASYHFSFGLTFRIRKSLDEQLFNFCGIVEMSV
jgi:hypothetical protein